MRLPPGAALALSLCACIAPSVVDPADRAPRLAVDALEWRDTARADLPGTYVSESLTGPLAAVLRKVVYCFDADGTYTGAALVDGDPPRFEVLSGTWRFEDGTLWLDDAPPAELRTAEDGSLRIAGEGGAVVLRREVER